MRARFLEVQIFDRPLPVGKKAEGFILIEILVVIVIIGTLAALMIPTLSGALERANTSKCASNLRQIGGGLLLFAGENSGNFPLAGPDIKHGQTPAPWTDQIEPYLGGQTNSINRIYICPSSSKVNVRNRIFSYFLGTRAAYLENGNAFAAVKLQKIESPSKFILGGDIAADCFTVDDADKDDYSQDPAFAVSPASVHKGRVNILFADGSVRAYEKFNSSEMQVTYSGTGTY